MCGIAGLVGPGAGRLSEGDKTRALDLMQHRGPDASGQWTSQGVWLGHRRLAIIDLSPRGSQPMRSPDARYVCTLNGEIYNFKDVRSRLEALGETFVGGSDTEVLVHAYARWGASILESLDGMFAFAIWDVLEKQLFLARDRFGEKPLYYARAGDGSFAFASDAKVVLGLRGGPTRVDAEALAGDLIYGYHVDSRTGFHGVRSLEPATYARVDHKGELLEKQRYWSWKQTPAPSGPYDGYLEQLEEHLRTVLRRRLISDRPLGVLLSGGIDSGLTAAIAAQEANRQVDAYTIAFDDQAFDESPYARAVAERAGLRHHVLHAEAASLEGLPRLLWHYGIPFHDFSCIPTTAAFQAVSSNCVVCLTGDGGDEMFAGYREPLLFHRLAGYSRIPAGARGILAFLSRPGQRLGRVGRRAAKWSALGALPFEESFAHIKDYIWNGTIPFRHPALRSGSASAFSAMAATYRRMEGDAVPRYLQAHAATQFANDFLVKVDVASMAHSVESRTPFLASEIAEIAASAPPQWLLNEGEPKRILRDLALKFLPPEVVLRPKQGFTPPLRNWLRGPLAAPVQQLLHPRVVERRGLFDSAEVNRLLGTHLSGVADHTYPLWVLTSLEIWWRLFVDASASPDMPLAELARLDPRLALDDVVA